MVLINENKFGSKAQSINDVAERLTAINWYEKAGVTENEAEETFHRFMQALQVNKYDIQWVSKEQVPDAISKLTFDNSELWEVLRELPDQLKKDIEAEGQVSLLEKAVDTVPQAVFHAAFEKAFQTFDEEKTVSFLVGHAMYIAVLACTAELADKTEVFAPLLEMLESGHIPLGPEGNTIYLL